MQLFYTKWRKNHIYVTTYIIFNDMLLIVNSLIPEIVPMKKILAIKMFFATYI